MRIARYILKAHLGPFLFSNFIIIFLFLLQFLMKAAGDLVGKGLSADIVLELIALNLAWMVVLAVPMSVLISTLMAFGRLSSENETVIMRASGMSLYKMMLPVMIAALVVSAALLYFNNWVLPEANIRLRTLMSDIIRIKPTFSIRAGVFTSEQELPNYRILVRRTFEKSNKLEGITIYDVGRQGKNTVLTAQNGTVNFTPDYSALIMDMNDGEIHEYDETHPDGYRCVRFTRHRVIIEASGFGFERSNAATAQRDDRTMNAQMMRVIVDSLEALKSKRDSAICGKTLTLLQTAWRGVVSLSVPRQGAVPATDSLVKTTSAVTDSIGAAARALETIRRTRATLKSDIDASELDERLIDKYLVEIYKKYSIPTACLVFVLIGAPLGMMVRKGGFGVSAGLSLLFFLFYWSCLIGGEKLADRDVLSPFWGMWAANIVLGTLGVWLTVRSAREATLVDWGAWLRFLPARFRRKLGYTESQDVEV